MNAQMIYAPGRKPGCLPRKSKPGEWCPLASEHIPLVPREEWDDWAKKISLGKQVTQVLDQGSVGSCATESSTQAVMISRAMSGLPFELLNPWFVYQTTSGGRDQGSSIDENLRFIREHGIASEAVWPRSKGWKARPSEEAVEDAKQYRIDEFYDVTNEDGKGIDRIVSLLLRGFSVVWGAHGHSVCKVAHLNDNEGLDVNSWGDDWKDHGFGVWAPYRQVNWNYGVWAPRMVRVPDDTPDPPAPL